MLNANSSVYENLPIDILDPDPQQARKVKPSKAAIEALNASVKSQGVLEPIMVRPNPEIEGRYLIVFGEGRWNAARAAGLATVPAVVRSGMTGADITASQAAENLVRNDMHPVDRWRAIARLIELGGDINGAAAVVGVTSEREMRRLQKLGKLSPKLLDVMTGNTFPDDRALSVIAMAPVKVQEAALKVLGKIAADDGVNWYEVAENCSRQRVSIKHAIFDTEKAGVVFTEDLFAEPGSDDQFTTDDVSGFLKAQRAALDAEAKVPSAHIQVVEWQQNHTAPALPKGWNRIWSRDIPKRFKKDDPRMVYAAVCPEGYHVGRVERVLAEPPAAKVSAAKASRGNTSDAAQGDAGTSMDDVTPAPRDPITKTGKDLIAAAKREAVQKQLTDRSLGLRDMLRLLLIAVSARNVTIQSGDGYRRSSVNDLLFKMVDADGSLVPLTDGALTEIASEVIGRIVVFESPTNATNSGPAAEWIGASIGAELGLPRFDTEEFLKCCTGPMLTEAAKIAEVNPAKGTGALRKRLVGNAAGFVPSLCQFGAPGPVPYVADRDGGDPDLSDPDALQDVGGVALGDGGDPGDSDYPEDAAGDDLTIPPLPATSAPIADVDDDQIEGGAPV